MIGKLIYLCFRNHFLISLQKIKITIDNDKIDDKDYQALPTEEVMHFVTISARRDGSILNRITEKDIQDVI